MLQKKIEDLKKSRYSNQFHQMFRSAEEILSDFRDHDDNTLSKKESENVDFGLKQMKAKLSDIEKELVYIRKETNHGQLIMQTDGYYCKKCKQLCFLYDQGLSCYCGQGGWENEKYHEEEYPTKWIKVNIEVHSAEED